MENGRLEDLEEDGRINIKINLRGKDENGELVGWN
jgi:hypothetical protein